MFIATDGVWEFITNEEVINIIIECIPEAKYEEACDRIMEESLRRWRLEEEAIDDTTFILVIFENKKIKHFGSASKKGNNHNKRRI